MKGRRLRESGRASASTMVLVVSMVFLAIVIAYILGTSKSGRSSAVVASAAGADGSHEAPGPDSHSPSAAGAQAQLARQSTEPTRSGGAQDGGVVTTQGGGAQPPRGAPAFDLGPSGDPTLQTSRGSSSIGGTSRGDSRYSGSLSGAAGGSSDPRAASNAAALSGTSANGLRVTPGPQGGVTNSGGGPTGTGSGSRTAQTSTQDAKHEPPPTHDDHLAAPTNDPESDRNPPVLVALRFDPPEARDGEATTLQIQVTDDLSGIKSASGIFRSPSGVAFIPFESQLDSGGGLLTARLTIPAKAETGDWYVSNLIVYDKANNPLIDAFTPTTVPPGGKMRVMSSESDSAAPDLRGISVDKPSLKGGEHNTLRVDVVDEQSGVASVTGAYQNPSKSALVWFICRLNAQTEGWEGDIPLPLNAECGDWSIQHLRLTDKAGNIAFPPNDSPIMARGVFAVTSPNCDSSAPTLERIELSPTVVSNGTGAEIQLTLGVHDEGSGTVSVTGWAEGPAATNGQTPRIHFSCTRNPNDPEDVWAGKILVPQFAAKGLWKVGLVHLQDRALNTRDYKTGDPTLASATFQVE